MARGSAEYIDINETIAIKKTSLKTFELIRQRLSSR